MTPCGPTYYSHVIRLVLELSGKIDMVLKVKKQRIFQYIVTMNKNYEVSIFQPIFCPVWYGSIPSGFMA